MFSKWFLNENYFIDIDKDVIFNIKNGEICQYNLNNIDSDNINFIRFNNKENAYFYLIMYLIKNKEYV